MLPEWNRFHQIQLPANALIPGIDPVYGVSVGYAEHNNTPAIAASPEPIAKVSEIVPLTFTPISCAASLSSDTASIACPAFVFLIKIIRPIMITIHARTATTVTPVMVTSANLDILQWNHRTKGFGICAKYQ